MCLTSYKNQQYIKKRTVYKVLNVGRNGSGLFYTTYYQDTPVNLRKYNAKLDVERNSFGAMVDAGLHAYTSLYRAKATATKHKPQYTGGYTIVVLVTVWGKGYIGNDMDIVTSNMEYTSFEPVFIYDPYRNA